MTRPFLVKCGAVSHKDGELFWNPAWPHQLPGIADMLNKAYEMGQAELKAACQQECKAVLMEMPLTDLCDLLRERIVRAEKVSA